MSSIYDIQCLFLLRHECNLKISLLFSLPKSLAYLRTSLHNFLWLFFYLLNCFLLFLSFHNLLSLFFILFIICFNDSLFIFFAVCVYVCRIIVCFTQLVECCLLIQLLFLFNVLNLSTFQLFHFSRSLLLRLCCRYLFIILIAFLTSVVNDPQTRSLASIQNLWWLLH